MNPQLAATSPLGQAVDDPHRLAALERTGLLDSPVEDTFDRFTRLASRFLGCPVSLVSLVDKNRQFFKSQIGLPAEMAKKRETPLSHSFCQHVVRGGCPLQISDAREDERVRENLAIPELGVIAYLGVPIIADDGLILGSFCVIDGRPREWTEEDLAVLLDLGQALAAEIRLRERTNLLLLNLREREAAEQGREQMLHMLVHDMRTPAGIILSTLDLLDLSQVSDPEQSELLSMARKAAEDLLEMIGQMLEVHRLREGKPVLQLAETSVADLLRETFLQMQPMVESRDQKLRVVYPAEGNLQLPLDRRLMARVLLNLATNASKYSPHGASILLQAETLPERLRFIVEDNGPGIPKEERATLFNAHSRGSLGQKRAGDSFGLGLAFCRLAVEAHGGSIWVEDRPGGGSKFIAQLPLVLQEAPAAAA